MINQDVWKRKRAIAIVRAGVDSPGIVCAARVRECSLTGPGAIGAATRQMNPKRARLFRSM